MKIPSPNRLALLTITVAGCAANPSQAPAPGVLRFGSDISQECDKPIGQAENALFATWAASFAIKSVVGLASSALEQATKPEKFSKHAYTHGNLYQLPTDGKSWQRSKTTCVRFWYANLANGATTKSESDYSVDDSLARRWSTLAFESQPYLYGEVLIALDAANNLLSLEPVVLYAKKLPAASSFWRKADSMSIALDLTAVGAEKPFATHVVELPDVSNGPVLLRRASLWGSGSAMFASPPPPKELPKVDPLGPPVSSGAFNALTTLTAESSATLAASAVAATFKDEKQKLIEALTPTGAAEKASQQQASMVAAFDAITAVLDTEKAIAANTDKNDVEKLKSQLQKAKFLADTKLRAAGLPARYGVAAP